MSYWEIILRIFLSMLMGGIIGLEREVRGRTAGFRTHMLVCMGSALFMATSLLVAVEYKGMGTFDPSRIAAGVVTGIGFLGAGAVIRYGSSVQGLTTAASIWAVSAVGLAAGAGLYLLSLATSVMVLFVLFLSSFERRLELKQRKE